MELTASDLRIATKVFALLDRAAKLDLVEAVSISYTANGESVTVGYGETGDPAIINADDARAVRVAEVLASSVRTVDDDAYEIDFKVTLRYQADASDGPSWLGPVPYRSPEQLEAWLAGLVINAPPRGVKATVARA